MQVLDFFNIALLIANSIVLIFSIKDFKKNILDYSALFYCMYFVFYLPVYIDYYYDLGLFPYIRKIVSEYNTQTDKDTLFYYALIAFIIMFCFRLGYHLYRKKTILKNNYKINLRHYRFAMLSLSIIWLIIIVKEIISYEEGPLLFFTPASKSIYGSFYEKYLVITIPYVLFTLKCIVDKRLRGRISGQSVLYALLLVFTSFPTGQRREIISSLIYIFLMYILVAVNARGTLKKVKEGFLNKKRKKKLILLGVASIFLIAFTWYGRVLFTQIQNNKSQIEKPWEQRSVLEVIYGSPGTCLPTSLAIHNYYIGSEEGPYLKQLLNIATVFVPRTIYQGKSSSFTEEMQINTDSDSNLSLFYVNDLYFTFHWGAIIVSVLFGFMVAYYYKYNINSADLEEKAIAMFLLSQIILLYKNGSTEFIIRCLFSGIIIVLMIKYVSKKKVENA